MDTMDMDMEMDMQVDVDLVPDEPIVPEAYTEDLAPRSPGEIPDIDPEAVAPHKVHIRGLDVLNPKEVKAYVAEHFPSQTFSRIEWIDDTSANLLFPSESVASEALIALSAETVVDVASLPVSQLLEAKPFSTRPEVKLQVRRARGGDRKVKDAASRSRFYLLNPEYDPEERARRRDQGRRYRDRDDRRGGGARGGGRGAREDEPRDHFDVNLYDDDEAALATRPAGGDRAGRRRRSYTPDSEDGARRRENAGKELFPLGEGGGGGGSGRSRRNGGGASRDRSRSPMRDRDGDRDMDGAASDASGARNRGVARALKSHMQRSSRAKELFPVGDENYGRLGDKEEDPVELLAKGITLPLMDGSSDVAATSGQSSRSQKGGGRLADRISDPSSNAFNIRGAASKESADQGFAIKGMGKSARELFPDKFGASSGNEGKELFGNNGGNRSRHRKKAGDLFD